MKMNIDENSGEIINLTDAKELAQNFKKNFPQETYSFFVGIEKVKQVVNQAGCIGIRIYNGYDEAESKKNIIIIGVDENGTDMSSGVILDKTAPCPPMSCGAGLLD